MEHVFVDGRFEFGIVCDAMMTQDAWMTLMKHGDAIDGMDCMNGEGCAWNNSKEGTQ